LTHSVHVTHMSQQHYCARCM